jgi:hypothetical protein
VSSQALAVFLIGLIFVLQFVGGVLLLANTLVTPAVVMLFCEVWLSVIFFGFGLPESVHSQGRLVYLVRLFSIMGGLMVVLAGAERTAREKRTSKVSSASMPFGLPEPAQWTGWLILFGRLTLALQCIQVYDMMKSDTQAKWEHYSALRIEPPLMEMSPFSFSLLHTSSCWKIATNDQPGQGSDLEKEGVAWGIAELDLVGPDGEVSITQGAFFHSFIDFISTT